MTKMVVLVVQFAGLPFDDALEINLIMPIEGDAHFDGRPARWPVCDLPKTATGTIQYFMLRALEAGRH